MLRCTETRERIERTAGVELLLLSIGNCVLATPYWIAYPFPLRDGTSRHHAVSFGYHTVFFGVLVVLFVGRLWILVFVLLTLSLSG